MNSERFLFFAAGAFGTALALAVDSHMRHRRMMRRIRWYLRTVDGWTEAVKA